MTMKGRGTHMSRVQMNTYTNTQLLSESLRFPMKLWYTNTPVSQMI